MGDKSPKAKQRDQKQSAANEEPGDLADEMERSNQQDKSPEKSENNRRARRGRKTP